jgi:hypothetical protein
MPAWPQLQQLNEALSINALVDCTLLLLVDSISVNVN